MKSWNPYVYIEEQFPSKEDKRRIHWENLCDLLLALALGSIFTVLILYWFDILV